MTSYIDEPVNVNEHEQIYGPLLTPRAIARGACGYSLYCRNTTEAIAGYNPVWFSLSPLDGVVPLERA